MTLPSPPRWLFSLNSYYNFQNPQTVAFQTRRQHSRRHICISWVLRTWCNENIWEIGSYCEEVKKWEENENTGCCQCFPNDRSVVWHRRRCLLGFGPIHLCLGSSLSNAIWPSEAIVSLMWQPKLGCFHLSSSDVKKRRSRRRKKTSQTLNDRKTGRLGWYLDAALTLTSSFFFNICRMM